MQLVCLSVFVLCAQGSRGKDTLGTLRQRLFGGQTTADGRQPKNTHTKQPKNKKK